jgi:hypothetical protein
MRNHGWQLFADGKGTNAIDASAVPHARHEARQMINEVLPIFLHGPVHNVTPPKTQFCFLPVLSECLDLDREWSYMNILLQAQALLLPIGAHVYQKLERRNPEGFTS